MITAADLRDLPVSGTGTSSSTTDRPEDSTRPNDRPHRPENRALLHARAADPDLPLPDLVRTVARRAAVVTDDTGRYARPPHHDPAR